MTGQGGGGGFLSAVAKATDVATHRPARDQPTCRRFFLNPPLLRRRRLGRDQSFIVPVPVGKPDDKNKDVADRKSRPPAVRT